MSMPTSHTSPKIEQGGNITILTFTDDMRDGQNVLARELGDFSTESGDHHLLLNFINVKYLNSVELGTLINLHKRLQSAGGRLTLFNLNAQVFQIFTTTRLDTLLTICREASEAGVAAVSATPE
ncbi:MAG TPA: STAS domain-containing protein [Gemmata sp.]|jgi:anti-anti-sigma factor|nr:STAS domain-containing protein [Gemmata sp.]